MALGFWILYMRNQAKVLSNGVLRRSPAVIYKCIPKRYIEFNFSPDKPFEGGGKAFNKNCEYPDYTIRAKFS